MCSDGTCANCARLKQLADDIAKKEGEHDELTKEEREALRKANTKEEESG